MFYSLRILGEAINYDERITDKTVREDGTTMRFPYLIILHLPMKCNQIINLIKLYF